MFDKLIDIGNCNLPVVHGDLKNGIPKSKWNVLEVLNRLLQVLQEILGCCENYTLTANC